MWTSLAEKQLIVGQNPTDPLISFTNVAVQLLVMKTHEP